MFRRGGSPNQGIMTGLVDRTKHADDPFVTGIDREQVRGNVETLESILR